MVCGEAAQHDTDHGEADEGDHGPDVTFALGGHVARCAVCDHTLIDHNSCRNRHCPKCQGAAAKDWLAARRAEPSCWTYPAQKWSIKLVKIFFIFEISL